MISGAGMHPTSGAEQETLDDNGSRLTDINLRTPDCDPYLLAQVREAFGRIVYSDKTRQKQADICFTKHRWQQGLLIALTAISSGTFLASVVGLLGSEAVTSLTTSSIALLVSWTSLGAKTFKYEEEANAHRDVAAQLWDIRESYISLVADLMSGAISDADARTRRDELQKAAGDIYASAPRTGSGAFKRAQEGLKDNEEMTFTAREIDLLLPERLRLNNNEGQS